MVIVLFLGCAHCCAADEAQQTTPAKTVDDTTDQLDQEAIMQMCNESFRTSMGLYSTFQLNRQNSLNYDFIAQNIWRNWIQREHSLMKPTKHQW